MAGTPARGGTVTAITGTERTLGAAVDAFLAQPRPVTTARTYTRTLERLAGERGRDRPLAGIAGEALGLDVADFDLASRQARARTKGGHVRPLHFQTAAARMLARLTAGRQSGPVFLTARRAAAHRVMAAADLDPASGRARLSYEMAEQLFKRYSGGKTLHQLRHS